MIKRIRVELTKALHLPRFAMKVGDIWEVRPDRMKVNGFELGGGFVLHSDYKVNSLIKSKA
tara:strand:+ start:205 stop:387 length:183 start_codon:yes stop_codon:yes gene_type:complete